LLFCVHRSEACCLRVAGVVALRLGVDGDVGLPLCFSPSCSRSACCVGEMGRPIGPDWVDCWRENAASQANISEPCGSGREQQRHQSAAWPEGDNAGLTTRLRLGLLARAILEAHSVECVSNLNGYNFLLENQSCFKIPTPSKT
jgi:hypothetical protein